MIRGAILLTLLLAAISVVAQEAAETEEKPQAPRETVAEEAVAPEAEPEPASDRDPRLVRPTERGEKTRERVAAFWIVLPQ